MTPLDEVEGLARAEGLTVLGGLHPGPQDGAPAGTGTLLLLGPDGPRWEVRFTVSPEARDGGRDPIDRWSRRVIGGLAARLGGAAIFPFEGPPWPPVLAWALRSGMAWISPIGMLVHARVGLWFSVRGILALPHRLALPDPPAASPCETCAEKPCRSACPVGAFAGGRYDVPACIGHLQGAGRTTCLAAGCAARQACPVGVVFRPLPVQAARHMAAFLASNAPRAVEGPGDKPVDELESD
ncbi:MAG TPA: ferredoxin [Paracoccaceae bacterium]|nr:ferredoxin [Paracoccaceae bacterium]